jgi:hypothetical protein
MAAIILVLDTIWESWAPLVIPERPETQGQMEMWAASENQGGARASGLLVAQAKLVELAQKE